MARRLWRDAATVILACKATAGHSHPSVPNYKLLMMKRSERMSFMANTYVFPGGLTDATDFSADWWKIFERRGRFDDVTSFVRVNAGESAVSPGTTLPHRLALMVTAIRETFEESGILLARPHSLPVSAPPQLVTITSGQLKAWQKRVQEEPSQFLQLFTELDCSPDIWALKEWSKWLTPSVVPKRFMSTFYFCTLAEKPEVNYSETEISNHLWANPSELLEMFSEKSIALPPPQIYELSFLKRYPDISELEELAGERDRQEHILMYPIVVGAKDGIINLLPGDDLYPKDPDFDGAKPMLTFDKNLWDLEHNPPCKNLNRITITEDNKYSFISTKIDERKLTYSITVDEIGLNKL